MSSKYSLLLAIALLFFLFNTPSAYGQDEALVKKISSETADGIRFSGWINRQTIRRNQNTIVNLLVENRSPRTIYLAWRVGDLYTNIDCDYRLHLYPSHVERDVGHDTTKFIFVKVRKGQVYRGALTIPITAYDKSRTYWIDISLGYVTDISGLKRQPGEDPARFNGLFNSRIEYVGLGGLGVDVKK